MSSNRVCFKFSPAIFHSLLLISYLKRLTTFNVFNFKMKKFNFAILLLILFFFYPAHQLHSNSVAGIIQDRITSEPLPSASIVIMTKYDSSIVTGGRTNNRGKFIINNIHIGDYLLKISYIGYEDSQLLNFTIRKENDLVDLGIINLTPSTTELTEIQIVAEKPVIELSAGKKIFNVDKNLISTGGTALDVMKNIPSIDIDNDGNISLRGSTNVKILIDGKSSSIFQSENNSLEKIPADMIEKIEIVTNPSARYDAEGVAGIINIILKRNINNGFNSIVSVNTGSGDKYSTSINLDYDLNSIKLFGGYDLRSDIRKMNFYSSKQELNMLNGDKYKSLDQTNNRRRKHFNNTLRAGANYSLDNTTTISLSSFLLFSNTKFTEISNYNHFENQNTVSNFSSGDYKNISPENNFDLSASFNKFFNGKTHSLSIDLFYSKSDEDEFSDLTNHYFPIPQTPIDSIFSQKTEYYEKFENAYLQAQYNNSYSFGNIETGIKSSYRSNDGDFIFRTFDRNTSQWIDLAKVSNHFIYKEYISAGYLLYLTDIFDFNFSLGLRTEYTIINTQQITTNDKHSNNYLDLFPSLGISKKIDQIHELQLNFSRRISRPNMFYINPYVDMRDPLNIRYGNPELMPEYINAYELSYLTIIHKLSFFSTLYYRNTNNSISRYLKLEENGAIGMTFINIDNDDRYGIELGLTGEILPWWRLNSSFNYYYSRFDGGAKYSNITNENYQWSSRINSTFTLLENLNLQISGFYNAPNATLQGMRLAMYSIDAGIRYELFNNKLTLNLNWNDIFDMNKFRINVNGEKFFVQRQFKRETSVINFNITYRLNAQKAQIRRPTERERQSEPVDMF